MGIEWTMSADKHEIDRADALYAMENAVYFEEEFDEPRVPGRSKPRCSSARLGRREDRFSK